MRCRLHQDRQGARRTEVTARPATQPDPARPGHSSAPMNLHPRRKLRSRRTNRPRPPHLRQPGFFIPALSCPVHTSLFSHLIPPLFPQRQHFPRFSAVAAWPFSLFPCYRPSGRHCHPVTLPQRQHFPHFAAVAALPFSRHH